MAGEPISIKGIPSYYYPLNDPNETSDLIWIDEEQGTIFYLSSYEQLAVIMHIAKDVKLSYFTK